MKKIKLFSEVAPKVTYEFRCTVCCLYFNIKLNPNLNGNYRVHCPNCEHIHYRTIENGKITDTRFPENHESILIEDLKPMKSSCRDTPMENAEDNDINNVSFSDKGKPAEYNEPFLHRLWREKFSAFI